MGHLGAEAYGLTPDQQETLELTYWEGGMSQEEVAARTGRSRSAIQKSLRLAEQKVAQGRLEERPLPEDVVARRYKAIVSARRRRPFQGRTGWTAYAHDPQQADQWVRRAEEGPYTGRRRDRAADVVKRGGHPE